MEFECEFGHRWRASLNKIRNGGNDGEGTWCHQKTYIRI